MKKSILIAVIAFVGITSAFGQEGNLKIGLNGGIPVGDIEEFASFKLGADVAYRYALAESLELGGLVGYSHFFGESGEEDGFSFEVDDIQFLPVAASGRYTIESFLLGVDLGYAIGINDGNEGGFYYRPHVGYNFGKLGVVASYSGISRDSFTVSAVNLGVELAL